MTRPTVTVLMPVRNGGSYLAPAIASILDQSFDDFELLIIEDGSTDGSLELLSKLADTRIRIIPSQKMGLVAALNLGLASSRGRYIARMDADDVSRVDRFHVQVEYLNSKPDVGLVCSNVRIIDDLGRIVGSQRDNWTGEADLRAGLLYQRYMKPIIHPSIMIRRDILGSVGGYRAFEGAEDRDLWLRALDLCSFARVQEDLLDYRIHKGGVSRQQSAKQDVSSAMAAVNWRVRHECGIDLYTHRPYLFEQTAASVEIMMERDVLPQARLFRLARGALQSRHFIRTLEILIRGVVEHGLTVGPNGARRATANVIEMAVQVARYTLNEEV